MVRRRPIDEGALREYWSTSPMMLCLSFKEGRRPETEGKLSSSFPSIHPSTFVRSPLLSCPPFGPSFLASGGGPNYHSGTRSRIGEREKGNQLEQSREKIERLQRQRRLLSLATAIHLGRERRKPLQIGLESVLFTFARSSNVHLEFFLSSEEYELLKQRLA